MYELLCGPEWRVLINAYKDLYSLLKQEAAKKAGQL